MTLGVYFLKLKLYVMATKKRKGIKETARPYSDSLTAIAADKATGEINEYGLMFLLSLVLQTFIDSEGKVSGCAWITDGSVRTRITRDQLLSMERDYLSHDRYRVAKEMYAADKIDVEQIMAEMALPGSDGLKLKTVYMCHIFLKPHYLDEIFSDYSGDRTMYFQS